MYTGSAVHLHHPPKYRPLRFSALIVAVLGTLPMSPALAGQPTALDHRPGPLADQPTQPAPQPSAPATEPPAPALDPAPDSSVNDRAEAVIAAARAYLGIPYRVGSEGPSLFDCSGLVYRAFSDAGELPLIGGVRYRAAGYMRWFAAQLLATTDEEQAERGDLVIYGNGEHIGIYLGNGRVLSALVTGVTVHSIDGITIEPTAFLTVDWSGERVHYQPIDGPSLPVTDEPEKPAALVPPVDWIPGIAPDAVTSDASSLGVERLDMRTANSRTFDLGNGRFTTEVFASPIFYRPSDSTDWQPIDLRFQPGQGDEQTAVASSSPVTLTASAVDPDGGFVSARSADRVVSLRVPPDTAGGLPDAAANLAADGRFADYPNLLGSGAGLRVFPRADGFKAFVVLDEEPEANRYSVLVDAPGLTLAPEPDGTVSLKDAGGVVAGRFARPLMLDSSDIDGDGGGLFPAAASLDAQSSGEGPSRLTLSVDRAFLDEAVYPVFLDLTLVDFPAAPSAGGHTFASSSHPNANFGTYQRPEEPGYYELWQGRQPGSRNDNEAYLRFGSLAETFAGLTVEAAQLQAFPYWQADAKGALPSVVKRVSAAWTATSLTWNTRPITDADLGELVTSAGTWSSLDVTSYVRDVVAGSAADYGLMLGATGSGAATWKRLVAESGLGAGALEPRLVITWTGLRPHAPPTTDSTTSAGSRLVATWAHPGLAPAPTRYLVQVSADGFQTITVTSPRSRAADEAATSWTIPTNALRGGTTYAWRVRAKYGVDAPWSDWSDPVAVSRSGKQESIFHRARAEIAAVL